MGGLFKIIIKSSWDMTVGTYAATIGSAIYEVGYYIVDTGIQIYKHKLELKRNEFKNAA